MRILVDLRETELQALEALSRKDKSSRAALIRQAIGDYLVKRKSGQDIDAFGLWGQREMDGLSYQQKLRSEW